MFESSKVYTQAYFLIVFEDPPTILDFYLLKTFHRRLKWWPNNYAEMNIPIVFAKKAFFRSSSQKGSLPIGAA